MQHDLVKELVKKWLPRLGLSHWIINIKFTSGILAGDPQCEATIHDDLKYLEADLEIFKPFWKHDLENQEKNIVHELVHLMLCRLHPYLAPAGDEAVEETVQTIAMIFYKNYE